MTPDAFDKEAVRITAILNELANQLHEHCDSVVIITTLSEGSDSQMIYVDKGSVYAIRGSVDRWREIKAMERKKKDWDALEE